MDFLSYMTRQDYKYITRETVEVARIVERW